MQHERHTGAMLICIIVFWYGFRYAMTFFLTMINIKHVIEKVITI
jgi:hypothetical protein